MQGLLLDVIYCTFSEKTSNLRVYINIRGSKETRILVGVRVDSTISTSIVLASFSVHVLSCQVQFSAVNGVVCVDSTEKAGETFSRIVKADSGLMVIVFSSFCCKALSYTSVLIDSTTSNTMKVSTLVVLVIIWTRITCRILKSWTKVLSSLS